MVATIIIINIVADKQGLRNGFDFVNYFTIAKFIKATIIINFEVITFE